MTLHYLVAPFLSWMGAGLLKFLVNSFKAKRLAFNESGNGGFPSSHTAIVSSVAALVAMEEGIAHPAFGVSLALTLIVILDANGLRQQVGAHAELINDLVPGEEPQDQVRERMGHTRFEIAGGTAIGILTSTAIHFLK
ncbi:divergent PAP2 family protein [Noviherbaspirillum sp. ST9]|uniref:divergent PAP2 family protein n=1 Tax=Noviherbaspirillum sp. ST9 TaxID=3401606 RepID=UPI003B586F95